MLCGGLLEVDMGVVTTIISSKVDEIKNAEWDIEVPESKINGKEWLKMSYIKLLRHLLNLC